MLRAIYQGGSSVILPNYHDIDYFYYYDSRDECKQALKNNTVHTYDRHFKMWENRTKIFIGCYAYPYMKYIGGEIIKEFVEFNICDHRQEYIEVARKYLKMPKKWKEWYHLLIAYYMFQNGANKLTSEQLNIVQLTHDNGISDKNYTTLIEYYK